MDTFQNIYYIHDLIKKNKTKTKIFYFTQTCKNDNIMLNNLQQITGVCMLCVHRISLDDEYIDQYNT